MSFIPLHSWQQSMTLCRWLKNVLTIDTANPYEHGDAKFVSDVLEYQLDDEVVPGTPLQRNARSEVNQHPPESYRTPLGSIVGILGRGMRLLMWTAAEDLTLTQMCWMSLSQEPR